MSQLVLKLQTAMDYVDERDRRRKMEAVRREKLALIEHLSQWNIACYCSPRDPLAVVVSTPTPRKEVDRRLDGLGDRWQIEGIGPVPPPPPRRPGKWCGCGRRLAGDNVTGCCLNCLRSHKARAREPETPKRARHREAIRLSRYRLGHTCSSCARPITDMNQSGVCARCRSIDGDPRWEAMVRDATVMSNETLRLKYSVGDSKAQAVRAESRRRWVR